MGIAMTRVLVSLWIIGTVILLVGRDIAATQGSDGSNVAIARTGSAVTCSMSSFAPQTEAIAMLTVAQFPGGPVISPNPPAAQAQPPPTQTQPLIVQAGRARLQGTLVADKRYAVNALGKNTNVQLTVTDLRILPSAGDSAALTSFQYLVLGTAWKNIKAPETVERPKGSGSGRGAAESATGTVGMLGGGGFGGLGGGRRQQETEKVTLQVPYVVPDLTANLYLLIDGRYVAQVSPDTEQLKDHLPLPELNIERQNRVVRGTVAFLLPATQYKSLALQFYDFSQGHITLPLYGEAPKSEDKPLVGHVSNALFKAGVYRNEFVKQVGETSPPSGSRYLLVDFGATSLAAGLAAHLDLDQFAFLVEDGFFIGRPEAALPGLPYQFQGMTRFLPGFTRHGTIAFVVPEQTGRLELLLAAASMDPLRFVLTPNVAERPQPSPVRTVQDGKVGEVLINSVTFVDHIRDAKASSGQRYLVLDMTFRNKTADTGMDLDPQAFTVSARGKEFSRSDATAQLPHPLSEARFVPPQTRVRFEIAFEVPADARTLTMKYQGFEKTTEVTLP